MCLFFSSDRNILSISGHSGSNTGREKFFNCNFFPQSQLFIHSDIGNAKPTLPQCLSDIVTAGQYASYWQFMLAIHIMEFLPAFFTKCVIICIFCHTMWTIHYDFLLYINVFLSIIPIPILKSDIQIRHITFHLTAPVIPYQYRFVSRTIFIRSMRSFFRLIKFLWQTNSIFKR